jgi:uncharacterized protein (DUF4415 family)
MKKLPSKQRRTELDSLAALPDASIDTSDIPELTAEQMRRAVRGLMYRPVKKPVTMRLDADVIAWLKQEGRGYQTKANALLRHEMLRRIEQQKRPSRAMKRQRTPTSKKAAS